MEVTFKNHVLWNERIHACRLLLGYDQKTMALRCGLSERRWHDWERGKRLPRKDTRKKIAQGLGVNETDIWTALSDPKLINEIIDLFEIKEVAKKTYQAKYQQKNKERIREYLNDWKAKNKDKMKDSKIKHE